MEAKNEYEVILFYKYVGISDTELLKERERAVCSVLGLKGRIIIAKEGINGTLEGTPEATAKYREHILSDKRFKHMDVKRSVGTGNAFPRLSVKVKPEIVSTKLPEHVDPTKKTGVHLPAHELKKWYDEGKDFVVIDMRNEYEIESGHFDRTINPGLYASRDLPKAIDKLRIHKDKTVVTVCTGGVRCEKMSAYLLDQGFKDVYQLHNGMHTFMEKYPGQYFNGTLFTFDNRITMHWGGDRKIVGKCALCETPTETYRNCSNPVCNGKMLVCDGCAETKSDGVYCKDKAHCGKTAEVHVG